MDIPKEIETNFRYLTSTEEKVQIFLRVIEGRFDLNTLETWTACLIEIVTIDRVKSGKHKVRIAESTKYKIDINNPATIEAFKDYAKDRAILGPWDGESELVIERIKPTDSSGFVIFNNLLRYIRSQTAVDWESGITQRIILTYLESKEKQRASIHDIDLIEFMHMPNVIMEREIECLSDLKYIKPMPDNPDYVRITAQGREHLRNLRSANHLKSSQKVSSEPSMPIKKKLIVFICYASEDEKRANELFTKLVDAGYDPWMDKKKLLPGQDWEREIGIAVGKSHAIIVCLSKTSVTKEGVVQKEIKMALDEADKKPEGTIFIIPLKFQECIVPQRLSKWQWVDLFIYGGFNKLNAALDVRLQELITKGML